MTVEKNNTIVIAMLIDWLKNPQPDFQPTYGKIFLALLSKLQVIARNSDWFIELLWLVAVIIWFFDSHLKTDL